MYTATGWLIRFSGVMHWLIRTVIIWLILGSSVFYLAYPKIVDNWKFVGLVANSIRPQLFISWSEYIDAGFNVELVRPKGSYDRCHLEVESLERWQVQRKSLVRVYLKTPAPTATSVNFTLEILCNTSQGEAKLPINLSLSKSYQWNKVTPTPPFQVSPMPKRMGSGIQFYRMHWRQKTQGHMIVLVYNTTHVLQHSTDESYIDMWNLSPNTQYVCCMIPAHLVQRIQDWRCIRYGTPMGFPPTFDLLITVRNLHLVGSGFRWAQVAWDAPSGTKHGRIIPRSYLLVLRTADQRSCQANIFYVEAPWIQTVDRQFRRELATNVRRDLYQQSCSVDKHEKLIQLLGPWPDWEDYLSSGWDDLGPLADFTVELDSLDGNDSLYELDVWPVVNRGQSKPTGLRINPTNELNDWQIQFIQPNTGITRLSWRVPDAVFQWLESQQTRSARLEVRIELIGRPDEQRNQICFVQGCNLDTHNGVSFLSQPSGSPQRVLCHKLEVPIVWTQRVYTINIPCLLPCKLYQIRVTPAMNGNSLDYAPPVLFSGRKRVVRTGAVFPMDTNLPVFSLARNAFLIQVDGGQASTHTTCAPNGYAVVVESMDGKFRRLVRLVHADQLNSWETMSDENSTNWALLAHNPLPDEAKAKVIVQNFAIKPGPDVRITSMLQTEQCRFDCIWSVEKPWTDWSNPWLPAYHEIYASALSPTAPMSGRRAGLEKCMVKTVLSGNRPARCQIPRPLNQTGHLYCPYEGEQWGTCALPQCEQMARIRCVTDVKPTVNTTSIRLEWNVPQPIHLSNSNVKPQIPAGFVAIIGTNPTTHYGSECFKATVVYMESPSDEKSALNTDDAYIQALLHSCPHFNRFTARHYPVNIHFEQLTHNSTYQVSITPFSSTGQLGASWIGTVQTLLAPPCIPGDLFIKKVSSRSMRVKWRNRVGKSCGAPTSISINYGRGFYSPTLEMRDEMELLISPLEACQLYCIELQLLNEAGASPLHPKLCQMTERDAFTSPPILQSGKPMLQHDIAQCLVEYGLRGEPELDCELHAQLFYAEKCKVHYRVKVTLFGNKTSRMYTFPSPELRIEPKLEAGFVYLLKVQATAPNYTEPQGSFPRLGSPDQSSWSNQLALFTGIRHVQLTNVNARVERPSVKLPFDPPSLTCVPSPTAHNTPLVLPSNPDLCIHVDWETKGPMHGLFGFVLQVFVQQDKKEQAGSNQSPNRTENWRPGTNTDRCVALFWIQCEDCLEPYTETNVHTTVFRELETLMEECGMRVSTMRSYTASDEPEYQRTLVKSMLLNRGKYSFRANQTSLNFVGSLYDVRPDSVSRSRLYRASRDTGRVKPVDKQGVIRLYIANTATLTQLPEVPWHFQPSHPKPSRLSSSGLAFLIIGLIILFVLIAVGLLFVLRAKRQHRTRQSVLQRMASIEMEDEAFSVIPSETKKPMVPPKLAKCLLHQPEPISVHELVGWLHKQEQNNYGALREEFKWLRVHSLSQQQAKHFTHNVGQRPENRLRNKYRNLVPFDHNYVRLSKPWCLSDLNQTDAQVAPSKPSPGSKNSPSLTNAKNGPLDDAVEIPVDESLPDLGPEQLVPSDYMNASLVPGRAPGVAYCLVGADRLPRTYIAAQAPVDHTRGLFWQLIWDHGVRLIVLLTKIRENGKDKCAIYWPGSVGQDMPNETVPPRQTVRFGQITVTMRDECITHTHIKRRLKVRRTNDSNGEERSITQLHMLQWPDFSAPSEDNFSALLYAYWTERRCSANAEAPVLIHCSAGVGRTGTFICLDQLCQQVRYYLQPDFEPQLQVPPAHTVLSDEPIYANVSGAYEDGGNRASLSPGADNHETSTKSSKTMPGVEQNSYDENGMACKQTLLSPSLNVSTNRSWSIGRKKRFGLGRKKSHCVDVYKTVLWLRSHRSYMVQSEDQYLFIYRYLSYFIQQINNAEKIYENI